MALETGEIIQVMAMFEVYEDRGQRGQEIDVSAFCSAEELAVLEPRPVTP